MANCKNCMIIRYFIISVFILILFSLIFTNKLHYLSFINPEKFSYLVLFFGVLVFLVKLYKFFKNKLSISNKSNKVRNMSGKPAKSVSSKKVH